MDGLLLPQWQEKLIIIYTYDTLDFQVNQGTSHYGPIIINII